jgi:hypothetical protein
MIINKTLHYVIPVLNQIPMVPMGVLAPVFTQTQNSAQPPIDTSALFKNPIHNFRILGQPLLGEK